MSIWSFDELAPILGAVGMAATREEALDVDALASELDRSRSSLEEVLDQIDRMGLILYLPDDAELPPLLTVAGSQYLGRRGEVDDEVLRFLPRVIDDLHAREAFLRGGTTLVDEFRHALVHGEAVRHARDLVPDAFESAVDERMAVNLFAAAVALMARLSSGDAAGCPAEEIMAVALLREATAWIEMEADRGDLDADAVQPATGALGGIFELFEDDDVLGLFRMEEPSDAAVAGHSPINRQMGVVDQRVEAWFRPFGGVAETGHLGPGPTTSTSDGIEVTLVEVEPGVALEPEREEGPGRFRVIVRLWDDAFLDRHPSSQMPSTWIYYPDSPDANTAMEEVRGLFPNGAATEFDFEEARTTTLERDDLARISVDVQRVGLQQEFSEGRAFHVVGGLGGIAGTERLAQLAANLAEAFPAAVVMSDGKKAYFGVSVNAESHEEADADLEEVLSAFGEMAGLDDYPADGSTNGQGGRDAQELAGEIAAYRRSG